jgi:hypothetical protein
MSQSKLHEFFDVSYNSNDKRCFIYDPDNRRAFFDYSPEKTDVFVIKKSSVSLFYRPSIIANNEEFMGIDNKTNIDVPLLKSNLQKAIRRKDKRTAVSTMIALLSKSPTELFRRLPIIYIEDVCLMTSFPIVVWFMMTDKEYIIKNLDVFILANIIISLCDTDEVYDDPSFDITTEEEEDLFGINKPNENDDAILALKIRSKYGGMKGDITLLKEAIEYYSRGGIIVDTEWSDKIRYEHRSDILPEAIDFHPYPQMLRDINKATYIQSDLVKKTIWLAESGVNYRKPHTIILSDNAKKSSVWPKIKKALDEWRLVLHL